MKTYEELEREAYITGNTMLAKIYADADDNETNEDLQDELASMTSDYESAMSVIDDIKDFVRNA